MIIINKKKKESTVSSAVNTRVSSLFIWRQQTRKWCPYIPSSVDGGICCCCCGWWIISFCRRSSITFRWEFECCVNTKVGLAAGRYSGTSRPDLYLTPQALQSVFGPRGPVLHCGVFSEAQCVHLRGTSSSIEDDLSLVYTELSLFFTEVVALEFCSEDVQLEVERERLLLDLPWNDAVLEVIFIVPVTELAGKLLNESSTKFDNHSNSATSSLCNEKK